LKANFTGLVAGLTAIMALALSWVTVSSTAVFEDITMDFTVYLYQVQGTINGTSASVFPNVWFTLGALALITLTALLCFTGSLIADRKGQLLLLLAGIAAILAVVIFGAGLLNSDYANPRLEPAAAMNLFEANTFGITADEAMESSYDFVWWLGYGFWLALATAVIAFVATVVPSIKKKTANT
jgi:hypothetical protein